jgi:hypothetical protein
VIEMSDANTLATSAKMMTVRQLDELSYRAKLRHWTRKDAWNPDGARLRLNNTKIEPFSVRMHGGDITAMPLLVGRPCFGILTAFLRYRDATKLVKGRGLQPSSRCASCVFRQGCERIVRNRLIASPALRQAYDRWLLAEGPASFVRPNWKGSHAYRAWGRLCVVAEATPFNSVNDQAVLNHYHDADNAALEKDRTRQIAARKKQLRAGNIDDRHLFDILVAGSYRSDDLIEAMAEDGAPRALWQLPVDSLLELIDVWVCREVLRAEQKKLTAASIARMIVERGWRNASASFGALSTRVSRDLGRIERLENTP